MICQVCQPMLHDHEGRIGAGPALELHFRHHKNSQALIDSTSEYCYICRAISSKIYSSDKQGSSDKRSRTGQKQDRFLTATLQDIKPNLRQSPQLYRLDFRVNDAEEVVASFVLEEIIHPDPHGEDKEENEPEKAQQEHRSVQSPQLNDPLAPEGSNFDSASVSSQNGKGVRRDRRGGEDQGTKQTVRSSSTSAPEVFDLAKKWIDACAREGGHVSCRPASERLYYPTRLIDLREVKEYKDEELKFQEEHNKPSGPPKLQRSSTFQERLLMMAEELESEKAKMKVHLISRRELAGEMPNGEPDIVGRYVTLSHCWGRADFNKLKQDNIDRWQKNGVLVKDLPKTFQDAFEFATQLEDVRYIWIDAMCIIQDDKQDWMAESAQMHEIYQNSYCNISATAATDSAKGLFNDRDSSTPWFDEVSLLLQGDVHGKDSRHIRCIILDMSFWDEMVDQAPANRRSWVYQERLLAPRVIHWCKDQIAFECREVDVAECVPDSLPHYQGLASSIMKGTKLKSIDLETGKRLHGRTNRTALSGKDEILYLYQVWKNLVEFYSKMSIGYHKDRLIALSGIAKTMAAVLASHGENEMYSQYFPAPTGSSDQYFAGMWRNYMASQLLWYVNEGSGSVRQPFEDTRPRDHDDPTRHIYRAPSFSWASVETSRGITFADTTDQGLLIRVEVIRLTYQGQKNRDGELVYDKFGLLTDGYLVIRGVLRKIELIDPEASWRAQISALTWTQTIMAAFAVSCIPIIFHLVICAIRRPREPIAALLSCTASGGILGLSTIVLHLLCRREYAEQFPSAKVVEHKGKNRYRWCLLHSTGEVGNSEDDLVVESKHVHVYSRPYKDPTTGTCIKSCIHCGQVSKPSGPQRGKLMEELYLDSPASSPSIFGQSSLVYCVPAAKNDNVLTCLLLQAVLDGDYGVRYRRIGLAKVSTMHGDVNYIVRPPGRGEIKLGQYYKGSEEDQDGESTICII